MIEDKELRDLFKAESEEHLQVLNDGLLQLESAPGDQATLDEVFRAAHSLKGSARMLGVDEVETVAHRLEDRLSAVRQGEAALTADDLDPLYQALDAVKLLVTEATTGAPAGVGVSDVIAMLGGAALPEEGGPQAAEHAPAPPQAVEAPPPAVAEVAPPTAPEEAGGAEPVLDVERVVVIEDPELRDLFRTESEEYLHTLEQGLHHLAAQPSDQQVLDETHRTAHNLKGSARMLGVPSVESVAQCVEDRIQVACQGVRALSPEDCDRLSRVLSAIRSLVAQAVTGEDAGLRVADIVSRLNGAPLGDEPAAPTPAPAESLPAPPPPPPPESPEPAAPAEPPPPAPTPSPASAPSEDLTVIGDEELRRLFQQESEEHLQTLDDGLLRLEKEPTDSQTLEEVFRAAHSLKGAARMLEVAPVERLAHQFEDRLSAAKRNTEALTPESIDALYQALVAMRQFVEQALTGTPASVSLQEALAQLGGEAPPSTPAPAVDERPAQPASQPKPAAQPAPSPAAPVEQEPGEVASEEPHPPARTRPREPQRVESAPPAAERETPSAAERDPGKYRLDTIRVDPARLDSLMTQSGELVVTKLRVAHRLADIEALSDYLEEWHRDLAARRLVSGHAGSKAAAVSPAELIEHDRGRLEHLAQLLGQLEKDSKEDSARLELVTNRLEEGIRSVRMLPLSTIFNLFPRTVRDLARQQSKEIRLVIEGGETTADKLILEDLKDPLMHMVRNAGDHGIEPPDERERVGKPREATLCLRAYQTPTNIVIEVEDDGRGLDLEKIKAKALKAGFVTEAELAAMSEQQIFALITRSGFSTSDLITDVSGRGVGMDVVYSNVEKLKGSFHIDSTPGRGTTFQIRLPLTLATTQVLILSVDGRPYAVPVESVETTVLLSGEEVFSLEGRDTVNLSGEPVSVARLADLLELPPAPTVNGDVAGQGAGSSTGRPCVVLSLSGDRLGLIVDELLDEQEVVLKPHSRILRRVRNVTGSTILETGQVCIVLNPYDLMRSVRRRAVASVQPVLTEEAPRQRAVLLAEDSMTTRVQMTRILEAAGYEVTTATDGLEAHNMLGERMFDALVSDIQMPNMSGLELAEKVRSESKYEDLPIILVTSLASDEDRRRGAEAGANAYITKPAFDQAAFLDTLRRLI